MLVLIHVPRSCWSGSSEISIARSASLCGISPTGPDVASSRHSWRQNTNASKLLRGGLQTMR
jgi:hypothetical protein